MMCESCWEEFGGRPQIDTPAIREAAALMDRVYEHSCVGGGLHVILDDWNIDDESLKRYDSEDDTEQQVADEEACLRLLKSMSKAERSSAIALHRGYWS